MINDDDEIIRGCIFHYQDEKIVNSYVIFDQKAHNYESMYVHALASSGKLNSSAHEKITRNKESRPVINYIHCDFCNESNMCYKEYWLSSDQ